jgi:hypothetical protein
MSGESMTPHGKAEQGATAANEEIPPASATSQETTPETDSEREYRPTREQLIYDYEHRDELRAEMLRLFARAYELEGRLNWTEIVRKVVDGKVLTKNRANRDMSDFFALYTDKKGDGPLLARVDKSEDGTVVVARLHSPSDKEPYFGQELEFKGDDAKARATEVARAWTLSQAEN